jgi:peptide/nickel transport system substrate-binding protein
MSGRKEWIPSMIALAVGILLALNLTPVHAQQLKVAVGSEPASMDASLNSIGSDYIFTDNLVEYLIYRSIDGKLGPGLATSWKVSPDGKIMDFTLRKGVKFHSGDLFTANDVKFSLERAKAKNPTTRVRLRSVDRVEIIDDYQLKIHFSEPDASFIPNRGGTPIVSKSYYDRVGEEKFVKEPVGTSPYKLKKYVPGEYADIERFDGYWGERPSVKDARFYFVAEDMTRIAKLRAGEVDIINSCPYPYVKEIEKSKEFKIIKFEACQTAPSILFHNFNPNTPWYDRRVRLAMAYAIDYKAIIKNVLYGLPNHYTFLAPYEVGYDSGLKDYPYDPKRAKELLVEAGYPKGFDLKLYWEITGRYPMAREIAEAAASYFEAVGIRTRLIGEETATHFARMRGAKKPDGEFVSVRTFGRAPEPAYSLALHFTSYGANGIYSNPESDRLIAEARATIDDAKRGELVKKAVKIIHDDVGRIPICDIVAFYAMKKNINFTPTQGILFDLVLVKDVVMK